MKRPSIWKLLISGTIGLVVLLIIGSATFVILVFMGSRSGDEFSPDDFSRRTYTECRLPIINYPFAPLTHEETTSETADYLVTNSLIPPSTNTGLTWETISSNESPGLETDISLLCAILDETDSDYRPFWISWSQKNPKMAKILWANMAMLVRDYLYWATTELADIARRNTDSAEFEARVNTYMGRIYYENGEQFLDKEDLELALERLTKSISFEPTSEAYRARSIVHDKLDHEDQMTDDLVKSRRLDKK